MTVGTAAVEEFHQLAQSPTSTPGIPHVRRGAYMGVKAVEKALSSIYFQPATLVHWFGRTAPKSSPERSYVSSLMACASAAKIYHLLPGATIATSILSQTMDKACWVPNWNGDSRQPYRHTLSRAQTFACIAMFDTGISNFDPIGLRDVYAISSGNSMYVAGPLLCDPYENAGETEIRHIAGNIGRPGLSMLVPPPDPKIHKLPPGTWNQLNFLRFDGKLENSFMRTSIHLSLTDYEMPLPDQLTDEHIIDRPVKLVETLVSVFDGERWVADLDVLAAFGSSTVTRFACKSSLARSGSSRVCHGTFDEVFHSVNSMVSVDNWEEFLERSDDASKIVRAHGNWLARLAFVVASVQQLRRPIILPPDICWSCFKEQVSSLQGSDHILIM
ncbi:MAG: hypothetical protein L6R42_005604 [Xanthoria sp. 1 TBL-2021]|nr:MAG: hypothetical protein L6R42_005604 [Xanthoria sp. 1 TBL-2021]